MALGFQFYKPTRFEEAFVVDEPVLKLELEGSSHFRSIGDAIEYAEKTAFKQPAVSLSVEPGSGKTTVFPFTFKTSRVGVVLPTGFDAWAAYSLASQEANIKTGAKCVDKGSRVTYMDSYTAGFLIFKYRKDFPYDILIIDESDSSAGITRTLSELRLDKCFIIHLSGTPEQRVTNASSSFPVEVSDDLPPITDSFIQAVDYIKQRMDGGRNIVMTPDSKCAKSIAKMITNSTLVCDESPMEDLETLMSNQQDDTVIVADDSCSRGFNLNLDRVFDFQVVGPEDNRRSITKHEKQQRVARVGRLKPGAYYGSGVGLSDQSFTQLDVFRNNVARRVFGLPMVPCELELDVQRLQELMVSDVEPYRLQVMLPELVGDKGAVKRKRKSISYAEVPAWVKFIAGYRERVSYRDKQHKRSSGDNFYTSYQTVVSSSSSDSGLGSFQSVSRRGTQESQSGTVAVRPQRRLDLANASSALMSLTVSETAVPSVQRKLQRPPVVDLSLATNEDWPEVLMLCYEGREPLPFVKPAAFWKYTSSADGVDFIQRLVCIAEEGPRYSKPEFEIVCRAWNLLVSRSKFSFVAGKDAWSDDPLCTFCLEYFQSYNSISFI